MTSGRLCGNSSCAPWHLLDSTIKCNTLTGQDVAKTKQYQHLGVEERAVIMIEHDGGNNRRPIARTLGTQRSAVNRELRRNAASRPRAGRRRLRCAGVLRYTRARLSPASPGQPTASQAGRGLRAVLPLDLLALVAAAISGETAGQEPR